MATVQDLLDGAGGTQPSGQQPANIASLLQGAGIDPSSMPQTSAAPTAKPSSVASRVGTGLTDAVVGAGQLLQHALPDSVATALRIAPSVIPGVQVAQELLKSVGQPGASTADVDKSIQDREAAYQAGRKAAGVNGFDWARTVGNILNPVNYAGGVGSGATVLGRLGTAAATGAATASLDPVSQPDNYWGGKLVQGAAGAVGGLAAGGVAEALSKPLSAAAQLIKDSIKGKSNVDAAVTGAIDQVLAPTGIDSATLPSEMVGGLKDQVKQAMDTNGQLSADAIRAQAEAASLPVPIKHTVGEASGDPGQFAKEEELAKVLGVGDELRTQKVINNQKLIANLDAMGADNAPTTAQAGNEALLTLAQKDKALTGQVADAFGAVRDSHGRSASLDVDQFYTRAIDRLKTDLPSVNLDRPVEPWEARLSQTMDDISNGKLPLTVDTMVKLDRSWGRNQWASPNPDYSHALSIVRQELQNAPIASSLGQRAAQAYQTAKGLARQQFQLSDASSQNFVPAYASMLKGMGNGDHDAFISALQSGTANIDPAKWFDQSIMKGAQATPAAVKKLVQFMGNDPSVDSIRGAVISDIKDQVVNGNENAGRAYFSNQKMAKVMDRGATLAQVLPADTMTTLQRLYNTSSRMTAPYKAPINWSGTAAGSVNLQAMKEGASTLASAAAALHPVSATAMKAGEVAADISKRRAQRAAAQAATTPQYATPGRKTLTLSAYRAGVPLSSLILNRDREDE